MHKIIRRNPALVVMSGMPAFEKLSEYYTKWEEVLKQIPEDDRVNQCISLYHCKEGYQFDYQDVLPIDIDGIEADRMMEYRDAVAAVLEISKEDFITVFTGHGIHCLFGMTHKFRFKDDDSESSEMEKHNKKIYKAICGALEKALVERGLIGNIDTNIFSQLKTTRIIGSINRKRAIINGEEKFLPDCEVKFLGGSLEYKFSMKQFKKLANNDIIVHKDKKLDTNTIIEECKFLEDCKNNPNSVTEPQWVAMLSILSKLPGGRELCHDYSRDYKNYTFAQTEEKIERVLKLKPYSCNSIEHLGADCKSCIHYNSTVRSPLLLKAKKFLTTKDNNFVEVSISKDGRVTEKVNLEELVIYVNEFLGGILFDIESGRFYKYNGSFWIVMWENAKMSELMKLSMELTNRKIKDRERNEFITLCADAYAIDLLKKDPPRKVNFKNGTLDLETKEFYAPRKEDYFFNCLNFKYDPVAKSPVFERYLDDVTEGRQDKKDTLLDFMTYAMIWPDFKFGQYLLLIGDGSNGKSVFLNILRNIIGEDACASFMLKHINNERAMGAIHHKKLVLIDETPNKKYLDHEIIKSMCDGGTIQANPKNQKVFTFKNEAKIIMSGNHLPRTGENGYAISRRVVIVHFDRRFTAENKDPYILNKIEKEFSGIFNLLLGRVERLKEITSLVSSEEMQNGIDEYMEREETDSIKMFFRECIITAKDNEIVKDSKIANRDLFLKFVAFCRENNYNDKETNAVSFGIRINKFLPHGKGRSKERYAVGVAFNDYAKRLGMPTSHDY